MSLRDEVARAIYYFWGPYPDGHDWSAYERHCAEGTASAAIADVRAHLLEFFAAPVSAAEFETSPKIKALTAALEAWDKVIVSNRYEQMARAIAAAIAAWEV